jgi:hypothetical protein
MTQAITNTILIGMGYSLITYIPWTIIFLLTQFVGIRLYTIHNREDCQRLQKRMTYCSHITDGGKGYGYAVGYWYIISISKSSDEEDGNSIWMIATTDTYKRLLKAEPAEETITDDDGVTKPVLKTPLTVYERCGSRHNIWFRKRDLNIPLINSRPKQAEIIEEIQTFHAKRGFTVAYLHGPPGSGKSMIGLLLADAYRGSYCNTFKPWQPGESLGLLYTEIDPTKDKPLIIAFDEFDTALIQIHAGVPPHRDIPTAVADKAGWNHMLDEIQRGMYPNVILLLTSNKTPEFIRSLDPSYIREGRVDLTFEMP